MFARLVASVLVSLRPTFEEPLKSGKIGMNQIAFKRPPSSWIDFHRPQYRIIAFAEARQEVIHCIGRHIKHAEDEGSLGF